MSAEKGDAPAPATGARSQRWLWGLAAVVGLVVLAGALAGALRGPVALPADSPERTVQDYVEAVRERDGARAVALFSEDLARRCRASDLAAANVRGPLHVTLDEVTVHGDRAVVTVRLRSDGVELPLPVLESGYLQDFALVREGDQWRIDEDPWPLYFCDRNR